MLTLNDGRSELWQWDTGRRLTVDAECSQVHFSNKVFGRSVDVDVVDGIAVIPDVLLQADKDLTAWAFVGTAENGYTKISKVFKVNKRNKPADYVFTPQDQSTLGEILDRIEDLENRPSGDVSEEDIQNAVSDYLDKNPISVEETDPTVPDWAKQPEKPTYTASEVGALPVDTVISGGGKTPKLLTIVELAEGEEVNSITINKCDDGTSFSDDGWKKVGVKYTTQGKDDLNDYVSLAVLVNNGRSSNGYGTLKQSLYKTVRKGYFTIEAQGCAIEISYKIHNNHSTQGLATTATHDIMYIPEDIGTNSKITAIQIYHTNNVMRYGTKIEVWGIE